MLCKREQRPSRRNRSRDKRMWVAPLRPWRWQRRQSEKNRGKRLPYQSQPGGLNFVRVADVEPRCGSIYGGGHARERVLQRSGIKFHDANDIASHRARKLESLGLVVLLMIVADKLCVRCLLIFRTPAQFEEFKLCRNFNTTFRIYIMKI